MECTGTEVLGTGFARPVSNHMASGQPLSPSGVPLGRAGLLVLEPSLVHPWGVIG